MCQQSKFFQILQIDQRTKLFRSLTIMISSHEFLTIWYRCAHFMYAKNAPCAFDICHRDEIDTFNVIDAFNVHVQRRAGAQLGDANITHSPKYILQIASKRHNKFNHSILMALNVSYFSFKQCHIFSDFEHFRGTFIMGKHFWIRHHPLVFPAAFRMPILLWAFCISPNWFCSSFKLFLPKSVWVSQSHPYFCSCVYLFLCCCCCYFSWIWIWMWI